MARKVLHLFSFLMLSILGYILWQSYREKNKIKNDADKFLDMFALTAQWVRNSKKGIKVEDYLSSMGYKRICVYGMGYLGQLFCDELSDSKIDVIYAIDKNTSLSLSNAGKKIKVITDIDASENTDAMIVTAIHDYETIKGKIGRSYDRPIISLEQVIYEGAGI